MDENLPPLKWCMGCVSKLMCVYDGVERVTRVTEKHTAYGIVTRTVRKCCPLLIENVS